MIEVEDADKLFVLKPSVRKAAFDLEENLTSTDSFGHFIEGKRYRVYNAWTDFDTMRNRLNIEYKMYNKGYIDYQYAIPLDNIRRVRARKGCIVFIPKKGSTFQVSYQSLEQHIDKSEEIGRLKIYTPSQTSSRAVRKKLKIMLKGNS